MNRDSEKEILEVLQACSEHYGEGPTAIALKDYSRRLVQYASRPKEFYGCLWKIPETFRSFPSLSELERDVKIALGIDRPHEHPVTQTLIDKHYEAQLREGVPKDEAMKGKLFMEELLNKKNINKKIEIDEKVLDFDLEF